VQVLDLVGSLANFCPGMLVFLAVTGGSDLALVAPVHRSGLAPAFDTVGRRALAARRDAAPVPDRHVATAAQGPLLGIASGLILATFVYGGWTHRMARVLAAIGLVSYGVYLWHWVILSTLIRHEFTIVSGTGLTATGVRVVALVSLTLPVATLSWLLIERPLLRRTAGRERRMNAREASKPPALAGRAQAPLPASSRP